jgi:hypothetical protein
MHPIKDAGHFLVSSLCQWRRGVCIICGPKLLVSLRQEGLIMIPAVGFFVVGYKGGNEYGLSATHLITGSGSGSLACMPWLRQPLQVARHGAQPCMQKWVSA